jgi:prepilin-type N-terminal cleavage/methylation domain-containing protein
MRKLIKNNKGVTIFEIIVVLTIIGLLALGITLSGEKQVEIAYEQEGLALIRDIVSKEKIYFTQYKNQYRVYAASESFVTLSTGIAVDARRNQYFRHFTATSKNTSIRDALGSAKSLPLLTVTVFGSGAADGKVIEAEYNKYLDELIIKD